MRKKLLIGLLAASMAFTAAIGFTACDETENPNSGETDEETPIENTEGNPDESPEGGGVIVPKGDKVTKVEWVEAFMRTLEVKNYTLEYSVDEKCTVKGTAKVMVDYSSGTKKEVNIEEDVKSSSREFALCDMEGDKAYFEGNATLKISGVKDGEKLKSNGESTRKTYYELSEKIDECTKYYWKADYSYYEVSNEDSEGGVSTEKEEENWKASEPYSFVETPVYRMPVYYMSFYDKKGDDAEEKNITELYDKFTYSNGVYTAKLYRETTIYTYEYNYGSVPLKDWVECTVSVSFNKAEKCVIGCGVKTESNDTLKKEGEYNIEYTYKAEAVYAISDIMHTDVSKMVNNEIIEALDKAKDEKKKANA